MELTLDDLTVHVPLRRWDDGSIRVQGTRMLLYIIIDFYKAGYSAYDLIDAFDILKLADVYAILAYYHQHEEEIDAFVEHIHVESERMRVEYEARKTSEQREKDEQLWAKLSAYRAKERYSDDLDGFFGQPFE